MSSPCPLSNEDKVWLYTKGYYCMQDPPVLTRIGWGVQEWIKWIDEHGSWGYNALKMRDQNNPMYTAPANTGDMPNGQA